MRSASRSTLFTAAFLLLSGALPQLLDASSTAAAMPFEVELTADKATARAGEEIRYELRVTNEGAGARVQDVQVTIPAGLVLQLPADAVKRSGGFQWLDAAFTSGETKTFSFSVRLPPRLRSSNTIRVTATAGGVSDSAVTTLPVAVSDLTVDITDGHVSASPRELLTYRIRITNGSSHAVTEHALQATIPTYAEFVDATEGGYWTGKTVLWQGLAIAPEDTREVTMTVRVRSDAPAGKPLQASATMNGKRSTDETSTRAGAPRGDAASSSAPLGSASSVVTVPPTVPASSAPATSGNASSRANVPVVPGTVPSGAHGGTDGGADAAALITKTTVTAAAAPGGIVRYTVTVRNVLARLLQGAVVTDTFDPDALAVEDAAGASVSEGMLTWALGDLDPGETWSRQYALRLRDGVVPGTRVANDATLTADGLEAVPADEKTDGADVSVRGPLAGSGSPLAVLAAYIAFPLSAVGISARQVLRLA